MTYTDISSKILENRPMGPDTFLLRLAAPAVAEQARPGQFVMVRANQSLDPLLRRPFSISDVDGSTLSLLVKIVGRGTRVLSQAEPGEEVSLLGPLGHGFTLTEPDQSAILLGGGIGVAPLLFLARELAARGAAPRVILGGRIRNDILLEEEFAGLGAPALSATEDGSLGHKGVATDLLEREIQKSRPHTLFACGPNPMLKVAHVMAADAGVSCQVSLEAHMACGLGACLGCAVEKHSGGYLHVCRQGPVVDGNALWGNGKGNC